MKTVRLCLWFLAASVLMLLVPIAQADTRIIGTATGSGIIPSGTYAGLPFTVSCRMEYSEYGRESLIGGEVEVTITTGSGVERFTNYVLDVGGGGVREERGFFFTGSVEHNGHRHLIQGSADAPPYSYLYLQIDDQTGTVFDPAPAPACDPGIGAIQVYDAIVSITAGALPVVVDIKPGSVPNAVNPKARGVIPVAILSTETFDATTVDPLTVAFGPAGATETHGKGHPEDANGDGKLDLVFHFKTEETGIQSGDVSAGLTGKTLAGQEIEGSDAIVTVGGGSSKGLAQDAPFELAQKEIESGLLSLRAYPNPFNPSTVIQYALPKDDFVSLKLYNSVGAEVIVLVDDFRSAGIHSMRFDARHLAGGVYFLRLLSGSGIQTHKMILLK